MAVASRKGQCAKGSDCNKSLFIFSTKRNEKKVYKTVGQENRESDMPTVYRQLKVKGGDVTGKEEKMRIP